MNVRIILLAYEKLKLLIFPVVSGIIFDESNGDIAADQYHRYKVDAQTYGCYCISHFNTFINVVYFPLVLELGISMNNHMIRMRKWLLDKIHAYIDDNCLLKDF